MNIKTCRFCRAKYESSWILPDGFCGYECEKSYNRNLEDQQEVASRSDREKRRQAYEIQEQINVQQRETLRLAKENTRISEEEAEARSLGISRNELLKRREKQKNDSIEAAQLREEDNRAFRRGLTREQLRTREDKEKFIANACLTFVLSVMFICICIALKISFVISLAITATIAIPLLTYLASMWLK